MSIVGPSRSGKSTLLHILGGVDKPTEGKVFIGKTDIHSLSENKLAVFRRRQIGLRAGGLKTVRSLSSVKALLTTARR